MMGRRLFLGLLGFLPFVRPAIADGDGVALQSMAHPFATQGEIVTCENGHPICEFARHVAVGEMFDPTAMTNWRQPEPVLGTMHTDAPCVLCGAPWFQGTHYHFATGWR